MKRTYPNLNRVDDVESRETLRVVYDLMYSIGDEGEATQKDLTRALRTLEELIPEVKDLATPSLFATAAGLGPGFFVEDVHNGEALVADVHSPSKVLFRRLRTRDLKDVLHETPRTTGDVLVYDEPSGMWVAQALAGGIDHGGLGGLGDDDHSIYILADGTRELTADWDAGPFDIQAEQLVADSVASSEGVTAGIAWMGNGQADPTIATFGRDDMKAGVNEYALNQVATGHTRVNCKTGTALYFCVGGASRGYFTNTAFILSVSMNMGNNYIAGVTAIYGDGDMDVYGGQGAGDDLYLYSTSHATKGKIYFGANDYYDEVNECLHINTADGASRGVFAGTAFLGRPAWGAPFDQYCVLVNNNLLATVSNDYALIQTDVGGTVVNCATSRTVDLRCNNATIAYFSTGQLYMTAANLVMNNNNIASVNDITGNGGSIFSGGTGAGEDLYLSSTTHATKDKIFLGSAGNDYYDEANEELYINTAQDVGQGIESGAAFIGSWQSAAIQAVFCQSGLKAVGNSYAIKQDNAGQTFVNCATNGEITFRYNNLEKFALDTTGTRLTLTAVDLAMASHDILGVDDIVGNSGSRIAGGSVAGTFLVLESTTHATKGYIWFGWSAGMIYDETNENLRLDGHMGIGAAALAGTKLRLLDTDTCYLRVETSGANLAAHLTLVNSNVANAQQWDVLNDGSAADIFCVKDNTGLTTPFVIEPTATTNSLVVKASGETEIKGLQPLLGRDYSCRIYHNVGQNIATGVWQAVTFNSERFDAQNMHVGGAPTRITPGVVGTYLIGANLHFAAAGGVGQFRRLGIYLNGVTWVVSQEVTATAAVGHQMSAVTLWRTTASTDYFEMMAYQNSGAPLSAMSTPGLAPEFWCQRVA